jgi:Ca2+-binding EF-hand superfamily protein
MLRQNGGVRGQYRTVAKLLRLFQEASWKGQDQLLHCLRAGDRRQTGAMRHQQFVRAMRTLGIYMSEHDYAELFKLFDQDK